jgi:hypothetical protein
MGGSKRGNAPQAQVRALLARSGNMCGYEGCQRELIFDAQSAKDQPKLLGKVAHISAASPGGARYRPELTEAQRHSVANLIFLCGDHHDIIDAQVDAHPEQRLLEMKSAHEEAVRRAVIAATGGVTYQALSTICAVIVAGPKDIRPTITLPIQIKEKIDKNKLGLQAQQAIEAGLNRARDVEDFLRYQSARNPEFEVSLLDQFKADYYNAKLQSNSADEVWSTVQEIATIRAGVPATIAIQAAALAVIAYVFEICEIFES